MVLKIRPSDVPRSAGAVIRRTFHDHHTSELTNGLQVVTVNTPAEFDAAGIVISCKRLAPLIRPLALPFDKSLFKGNRELPERMLLKRLDGIVGSSHGRAGREHVLVGGAVSPLNIGDLLRLLREMLGAAPNPVTWKEYRQAVEYDWLEMKTKHPEKMLPELAVAAAFPGLGTSVVDEYLALRRRDKDNGDDDGEMEAVEEFWKHAVTTARLSLIGLSTGHGHLHFVELANKLFIDMPNAVRETEPETEKPPPFQPTTSSDAMVQLEDPEVPLLHLTIAYPGLPAGDPGAVAMRVLERLLGGGGSFSAGGPGKGMYARLYTSVLSRYHWMESARCFSRSHSAAGIFGVHGSAPPQYARDLMRVLLGSLQDAACRPIRDEELRRAQAQLKSAALMELEGRLGQLDDVAEQIIGTGLYMMPERFAEAVDAVTGEQLQALAKRLVTTAQPSITAYGQVENVAINI